MLVAYATFATLLIRHCLYNVGLYTVSNSI